MTEPRRDDHPHMRWEYLGAESSGPILILRFQCLECGRKREDTLDFSALALNRPESVEAPNV